jgi:hypothetical protein
MNTESKTYLITKELVLPIRVFGRGLIAGRPRNCTLNYQEKAFLP